MQIKVHRLPEKNAMVGGLAADPAGRLWLGLAGTVRMVWRFDPATGEFAAEPVEELSRGYSYVHRSVVPAGDGRLYVGVTWLAGVDPTREKLKPFSPGNFAAALALVRWFGRFVASCRILCREPDGTWHRMADRGFMSIDLHWDARQNRLLRWSPLGVGALGQSGETIVLGALKGFVHELAVGPEGELLLVDEEGGLYLQNASGQRIRLGSLEDEHGRNRAVPGIDGVVAAGHHFVGGTRNLARPFVVDLRIPSLRVLAPLPTAPRASALCVHPDGKVYFASGVGKVGLYRLDPEENAPERVGTLEHDGVACHHVHELVVTSDGRLFAGEFFPLDVPDPPWPARECMLWEITP